MVVRQLAVRAKQFQGQDDVLPYGQSRNQVEELKNEANFSAPEEHPISIIHPGQVLAIKIHLAAVNLVNTADQVEQGCLSATALTQVCDKLAFSHLEVGVFEHMPHLATLLVTLAQAFDA